MAEQHFSPEALSIGTLVRTAEARILASASLVDDLSIVTLGVATVVAAMSESEHVDLNDVESVLKVTLGANADGGMRFVDFVRSLSTWVNATVTPTGAATA